MASRYEPALLGLPTWIQTEIVDYLAGGDRASLRSTCTVLSCKLIPPRGPSLRIVDRETGSELHLECVLEVHRGSSGSIYQARCLKSGTFYAMSRVRVEEIGYYTLREISALKLLSHPNIIPLLHVSLQGRRLITLSPFVPTSLYSLLREYKGKNQRFSNEAIRKLMGELLGGLDHCHRSGVMHRNITPKHLLLHLPPGSNNFEHAVLKISGFTLARIPRNSGDILTTKVVTLWYRAPELLLGDAHYSANIDVWSAGCIYAELLRLSPLFSAFTEIDQLFRIFQFAGTPDEQHWPEATKLPYFSQDGYPRFPRKSSPSVVIREAQTLDREVLDACLTLSPKARATASQALALLSQHGRPFAGTWTAFSLHEELFRQLEYLLVKPEASAVAARQWKLSAGRFAQYLTAEQKSIHWLRRQWTGSPIPPSPYASLYPNNRSAVFRRMANVCKLVFSNDDLVVANLNRCWLLYDLICYTRTQSGAVHLRPLLELAVVHIIFRMDNYEYPSLDDTFALYFGEPPQDIERVSHEVLASETVILATSNWMVYIPSAYDYWKLAISHVSEDLASSMKQMLVRMNYLPILCVVCRQALMLDKYPQAILGTAITALLWTAVCLENENEGTMNASAKESQALVPHPSLFERETGLMLDELAVQAAVDILSTGKDEYEVFLAVLFEGMQRNPPTDCELWSRLQERAR